MTLAFGTPSADHGSGERIQPDGQMMLPPRRPVGGNGTCGSPCWTLWLVIFSGAALTNLSLGVAEVTISCQALFFVIGLEEVVAEGLGQ